MLPANQRDFLLQSKNIQILCQFYSKHTYHLHRALTSLTRSDIQRGRPRNRLQWSKQITQQQSCRSQSLQCLFFLWDSSHHWRYLHVMSIKVDERYWDRWCEFSNISSRIVVLTAHCTIFALRSLIKSRGHAAVCDECWISVCSIVQSYVIWNLRNPVALELKQMKLCQFPQDSRSRSSESIVTET